MEEIIPKTQPEQTGSVASQPIPAPPPTPPQTPPVEGEGKVLRQLEKIPSGWRGAVISALAIILIIAAGIASGYFLSRKGISGGLTARKLDGEAEVVSSAKEAGIKDERVFRDSAEGKLKPNDFSKVREGSHKLLRPGGDSQTAYLTSSVVDLGKFVNKCVQVWGETFSAQAAGWFMDVGRVKILEKCPEGV
jgi:hypothetical protein